MMYAAATRALALAAATLLALALWRYPFWPWPATGAAAGYLLVQRRWPDSWLLLVPAALPWLDLAPWTGRFYLEELDLLLLATVAAGYWRLHRRPATLHLTAPAGWLLALWLALAAQAAVHGALPLPAPDADAFASYGSGYNSLRLAKGALWALLLLPLLRRAAGPSPADAASSLGRLLVPGMLLGLLMTCLAVIWERWRFPGLINFSSDYRPTAPFSAMHTGGAALDAYLALALPFAAWWLTGRSAGWQWVAALMVLMLGLFTGFTTFSRDVWLAYAGAAGVIIGCHLGPRLASGVVRPGRLLGLAVMLVLCAWLLARVFDTGGYRTLAAALVLAGATLAVGAAPAPLRHRGALVWGGGVAVLLVLANVVLFLSLRSPQLAGWSKGPYLALALCAAVCAGGLLAARPGAGSNGGSTTGAAGLAIARGAWPPLALAMLLVALHWGGTPALPAAALLAMAAAIVLLLALRSATPQWRLSRATVSLSVVSGAWLALAIPVLASAYMGERLATVGQDFALRARHWREATLIMPADAVTQWFGAGLGRYPALYDRRNLNGDQPGSFRYPTDAGNRYLRLVAPRHARGYGEVLRHLQHVAVRPATRYRLAFDMRRQGAAGRLKLALCERWLLYPQNCVTPLLPLTPADRQWRRLVLHFDSGALGVGSAGLPGAPVQLSMAVDANAGMIDIDNISLAALADGAELVRNGSFAAGQDGWFFSSDRDHLPWHIKNLYVHTYVEQGWTGLAALALLLGYVVARLVRRAWRGRPGAAVLLAALAGMLLVGCFDSIVDVPRLTLLVLLLVMSACLRPARIRTPVQPDHQA